MKGAVPNYKAGLGSEENVMITLEINNQNALMNKFKKILILSF